MPEGMPSKRSAETKASAENRSVKRTRREFINNLFRTDYNTSDATNRVWRIAPHVPHICTFLTVEDANTLRLVCSDFNRVLTPSWLAILPSIYQYFSLQELSLIRSLSRSFHRMITTKIDNVDIEIQHQGVITLRRVGHQLHSILSHSISPSYTEVEEDESTSSIDYSSFSALNSIELNFNGGVEEDFEPVFNNLAFDPPTSIGCLKTTLQFFTLSRPPIFSYLRLSSALWGLKTMELDINVAISPPINLSSLPSLSRLTVSGEWLHGDEFELGHLFDADEEGMIKPPEHLDALSIFIKGEAMKHGTPCVTVDERLGDLFATKGLKKLRLGGMDLYSSIHVRPQKDVFTLELDRFMSGELTIPSGIEILTIIVHPSPIKSIEAAPQFDNLRIQSQSAIPNVVIDGAIEKGDIAMYLAGGLKETQYLRIRVTTDVDIKEITDEIPEEVGLVEWDQSEHGS